MAVIKTCVNCSSSQFEQEIKTRIEAATGENETYTESEIQEICRMFSTLTGIANRLNFDLVLINKQNPACT